MEKRIFVDNLSPKTTPEALTELFRSAGAVESVVIPDGQSASVPSHAFVEMDTVQAASNAIHRLNDTDWNGFRLTVTHAGPAHKRGSGFSGGGTLPRRRASKQ